jgi:2',3'-cyclic-nucleotide 2'-phosphodiesterase (5'-nucleotidase family)
LLAVSAPAGAVPVPVSIVGTNDWHGHIERMPVFAGFMNNLQQKRTTIIVDAGDALQGTLDSNLLEGAPVVDAMNVMGVSALAVGNHEYDFGPAGPDVADASDRLGALRARAKQARFPFLVANALDAGRRLPLQGNNFAASTMVRRGGLRIGVVVTPTTTIAANLRDVIIVDPAAAAIEQATYLRRNGADVVVLAAHVGGKCEKAPGLCDDKSEIVRLAKALPSGLVDVIVAGHTHSAIAHVIHGIPVIESHANGRAFGRVDLLVDVAAGGKAKVTLERLWEPQSLCVGDPKDDKAPCNPGAYEGAQVRADAAVQRIITPAVDAANARKQEPLGVGLSGEMVKGYDQQSPLANLFADLMRESRPDIDVALMNGGGIRANLPAGQLHFGDVYLMMPFDNRLARLTMTGAQLRALLERNLHSGKGGGLLAVSGIRTRVTCAAGNASVQLWRGDIPIYDGDELRVLATDFMAQGGDGGLGVDVSRIDIRDGDLLRDALVEALRARGRASSAPIDVAGPVAERRLDGGRCPTQP